MIWRTMFLAVAVSLPLFSEPAEIMYFNYFGDYLTEEPYEIDINVDDANLKEIQTILQKRRGTTSAMDTDLVVIGYGPQGEPSEFFAATSFVDYQIPLRMALSHLPTRKPNAKWYLYFINRSISPYVRARQDHHWSSPFRYLAQIGLQDLQYFGPFLANNIAQ